MLQRSSQYCSVKESCWLGRAEGAGDAGEQGGRESCLSEQYWRSSY
ncbi:MAG: hypothetical protein WBM86_11380 [Waterburya sp.]